MNCPQCQSEHYYEGFHARECGNPSCELYVAGSPPAVIVNSVIKPDTSQTKFHFPLKYTAINYHGFDFLEQSPNGLWWAQTTVDSDRGRMLLCAEVGGLVAINEKPFRLIRLSQSDRVVVAVFDEPRPITLNDEADGLELITKSPSGKWRVTAKLCSVWGRCLTTSWTGRSINFANGQSFRFLFSSVIGDKITAILTEK